MIAGGPVLAAVVFAVVGICCLLLWIRFQTWAPLVAGLASLLVAAVFPLVLLWNETPEERIERTLNQLAMAIESNDTPGVLRHISPAAERVRKLAELEMQKSQFTSCWVAKIHKIAIDQNKAPPEARVSFGAIVSVSESQHTDGPARGRVQIVLDMVLEADGAWRIAGYDYAIE
jgi:hypothetical protein